jgi:dTDP-4-amino-4,6-dideoxygalactose transaminase
MRVNARKPAIAGGKPIRETFLPYGLHDVGREEEIAVLDVLRHGWLTAGPRVKDFEAAFAAAVGAKHAVALATGTAALHLTMLGLGIGPGDEVITSPLTFVATANGIVHAGAKPVFADVVPETLNMDPGKVVGRITRKTRALLPVHFAGAPCDLEALRRIARSAKIPVVEDACHAVGATSGGLPIGARGDAQCFSFHPVKNITTAEGAMVTTPHRRLAETLRMLRFHGFKEDYLTRSARGALGYPRMHVLGVKSILTDLQAALGLVQLKRLKAFIDRRSVLAERYNNAFAEIPEIQTPSILSHTTSAWHIYVLRLRLEALRCGRDEFMEALRQENIGTSVHYMPIHLQPYYRKRYGFRLGDFPTAEDAYRRMLTLPLFPKMSDADQEDVTKAVFRLVAHYKKR